MSINFKTIKEETENDFKSLQNNTPIITKKQLLTHVNEIFPVKAIQVAYLSNNPVADKEITTKDGKKITIKTPYGQFLLFCTIEIKGQDYNYCITLRPELSITKTGKEYYRLANKKLTDMFILINKGLYSNKGKTPLNLQDYLKNLFEKEEIQNLEKDKDKEERKEYAAYFYNDFIAYDEIQDDMQIVLRVIDIENKEDFTKKRIIDVDYTLNS